MRITFNLIEKAVDLAVRVFTTVRDTGNNTVTNDSAQLATAIDEVSRRIDAVASDFAGQLAGQLEKLQLERLSAQAKVVRLALEIDNDAMLGTAVASISEQIEYSRLRLAEGKHEWFGPWMIAESVRIEALRIMSSDKPRGLAVLERETAHFRINILNHVGALLIGSADNPWVLIADFVEGRNENVLLSLGHLAELQMPPTPAAIETGFFAAPDTEAKSMIAPAAAWPFPTT
jgi:hypothetical protein